MPRSARWLSLTLHPAAGVAIAVVAVEVFPEALEAVSPVVIGLAFLSGGLLYLAAQWLIEDGLMAGR